MTGAHKPFPPTLKSYTFHTHPPCHISQVSLYWYYCVHYRFIHLYPRRMSPPPPRVTLPLPLLLLLPFWLVLLTPAVPALAEDVLVVHSYHQTHTWVRDYTRGLVEALGPDEHLDHLYMDTKRLPESQYEARAREALERVAELNPDLVVLADDNALKYVGPLLAGRELPVVFLGVNRNPRDYLDLTTARNITGILERPLLKRASVFLHQIFPGRNAKFLVLFDDSTTTKAAIKEIDAAESLVSLPGSEIRIEMVGDWGAWREKVRRAKETGYAAVLLGTYHRVFDGDRHVDEESVLRATVEESGLPVFALWDFSVGPGRAVGGYVLSGYEQGLQAGYMARRILQGAAPRELPTVLTHTGRFVFSRSELKRLGLALPEEFTIGAYFTP